MSSNKKDLFTSRTDSHAALRATTIDKAIARLEDIVSHKGVTIKATKNEVLDAIEHENGVLTSDEDVFNLAKSYCVRGQIKQAKDRCPVVDVSVTAYFSFEETAHTIAAQLLGRSLRFTEKPAHILFESIAIKRRERSGKKPLLYIIVRWEGAPKNGSVELISFLDVLKSLIVTREARVLVFAQNTQEIPADLSKFLKTITTGGYFS